MLPKIEQAKNIIGDYKRVIVAFSGGVDSLYLLKLAVETLGKENILAVTAKSPLSTVGEAENARHLSNNLGVGHMIVELDELSEPKIANNPIDRCYHCKRFRYEQLMRLKDEGGYDAILDGSNFSDLGDYRPGMRACEELGIVSPLKLAGFTKDEIRQQLKTLGIPQWDTPSRACLASRIPYGDRLTRDKLARVDNAEQFLMSLGFKNLRVRLHGDIARIELPKKDMHLIFEKNLTEVISEELRKYGCKFVTLDLEGLRSGSLNPDKEVLANEGSKYNY